MQDYQTREILQALLKDTEDDYTHWLEQQLGMIERIGLQNYLLSQMSPGVTHLIIILMDTCSGAVLKSH